MTILDGYSDRADDRQSVKRAVSLVPQASVFVVFEDTLSIESAIITFSSEAKRVDRRGSLAFRRRQTSQVKQGQQMNTPTLVPLL
jgi:hypothetical protein